jgi:hypothetical protein
MFDSNSHGSGAGEWKVDVLSDAQSAAAYQVHVVVHIYVANMDPAANGVLRPAATSKDLLRKVVGR